MTKLEVLELLKELIWRNSLIVEGDKYAIDYDGILFDIKEMIKQEKENANIPL